MRKRTLYNDEINWQTQSKIHIEVQVQTLSNLSMLVLIDELNSIELEISGWRCWPLSVAPVLVAFYLDEGDRTREDIPTLKLGSVVDL